MPEEPPSSKSTLALNTRVERDFVAPLTAARGALEILRDFPDLEDGERQRFVTTALHSCTQLEHAIEQLSASVYAAAQQTKPARPAEQGQYAKRITRHDDIDIIELDFSDFVFANSDVVNEYYDVIDETARSSGRAWYFLVNFRNCSVWPEAWVAFAHRGKKVAVNFALGTVRYGQDNTSGARMDPNSMATREAALARIEELKATAG